MLCLQVRSDVLDFFWTPDIIIHDLVRWLFLSHFLVQNFVRWLFYLIICCWFDHTHMIELIDAFLFFASFPIEKLVQDLWEKKLGPNCFCLHHINHLGAQACIESFLSNFTKKDTQSLEERVCSLPLPIKVSKSTCLGPEVVQKMPKKQLMCH